MLIQACITGYFCAKNLTSGFVQVSESFFIALADVNNGGTTYMGISPGRTRPCTHRLERERTHQHTSIGSATRDSLGKNVSKEVCFCLWGKDNLVQLPEEPSVTWTVDAVCFSAAATEFLKCFVDERFINKAQFDAGFAHRLILKDGAIPAIKDPGHDSALQTVSETASNVFCFQSALKCSSLFSSAHDTPPEALLFFGENRKAVSFFYKYDKTKDFLEIWRMQYYSIGTQD